jgi:hypothetical protein
MRLRLQCVYDNYRSTYDSESRKLAKSVTEYPIEDVKERITLSASVLRERAVSIIKCDGRAARSDASKVPKCNVQLSKCPAEFGELLGLVCASWTFLACKGKSRSKEVHCLDIY